MTTRSLPCSQKWETDRRLSRRSSVSRKATLTQRTKFHRPNQPPRVQRRKQASDEPAQQTTSSRLSQSPNVPRRKRASAICATRSRTLSQETPRQQSPSLFFENTPAREPAQLVCNIGLGHTSDQTTTSKPVFTRAEQDLLQLTIRLTDLKETLATMFPDKNKREQAERRIQQATSRSTLRGHKPKPAARHKQNATDSLYDLKQKWMKFQLYLMYFPTMKITKELQFTQLSVLLTLHKLTLSDLKLKTWSDPTCAKQIKISTLNNPGQAMKNS